MIEVENTDVNIVRNLIPMRNHMPASAYGLKAISDWLAQIFLKGEGEIFCQRAPFLRGRSRDPKFFWGGYPLDSFRLAQV